MQISAVQVNLALRAVKETKTTGDQEALRAAEDTPATPLTRADTFERSPAAVTPPSSGLVVKIAAPGLEQVEDDASIAQPPPVAAQLQATPSATSPNQNPLGETTQPIEPRTFSAADRDALLASWGARTGEQRFTSEYDLDGDGVIGSSDLAQLLGAFKADPNAAPTPAQGANPSAITPDQPAISPEVKGIRAAWNKQTGEEGYDAAFDLNSDGVVNSTDLALSLGGQHSEPAQATKSPTNVATLTPVAQTQAPENVPLADQIKNLNSAWGSRKGDQAFNAAFDFDGDGVITSSDLAHLLGQASQKL